MPLVVEFDVALVKGVVVIDRAATERKKHGNSELMSDIEESIAYGRLEGKKRVQRE